MSVRHGTTSRYRKGCRCPDCLRVGRAKASADSRARNARLRAQGLADDSPIHGTSQGYRVYKCRCDKCKAWAAEYWGEWRRTQARLSTTAFIPEPPEQLHRQDWRFFAACKETSRLHLADPRRGKFDAYGPRAQAHHICVSHCRVREECELFSRRVYTVSVVQGGLLWTDDGHPKADQPQNIGCGGHCAHLRAATVPTPAGGAA